MVWINENINSVIVQNSIQIINLLTAGREFMLFDTTIMSVIVTDLAFTGVSDATVGKRQIRCALLVAIDTIDSADMPALFSDTVGTPWLGVWGNTALVTASQAYTISLSSIPAMRFAAKRRFRENNASLFLVVQNVIAGGGDTALALDGMIRTLVRIP